MTEAIDKLARSRLSILEFYFDVAHRASVEIWGADVLSRLKTGGDNTKTLGAEIPEMTIFDQWQTQNGN